MTASAIFSLIVIALLLASFAGYHFAKSAKTKTMWGNLGEALSVVVVIGVLFTIFG